MTIGMRPDDHIGADRRPDDRRVGGGPKEERQARASGRDGGERCWPRVARSAGWPWAGGAPDMSYYTREAASSCGARSRFNPGVALAGGTGIEPATCGFGVCFLTFIVVHHQTDLWQSQGPTRPTVRGCSPMDAGVVVTIVVNVGTVLTILPRAVNRI